MVRTVSVLTAIAIAALAPDALGAQPQLGKAITLVERTGLPAPMTMMAAASARGSETFAWVRFGRTVTTIPSGFGGPSSVVQATLRGPRGRLTAVQNVSPSHGRAFLPAIGMDSRGAATAIWLQQLHGGTFTVMVSVRRPGGRFGRAVVVGRTRVPTVRALYPRVLPYDYGAQPALAVAADGATVIAWRGSDALQVSVRKPGPCAPGARRGCFSRPQALPLGAEPRVAFGPRDRAYVVWGPPHGAGGGVRIAAARPGGSFRPARMSAADGSASHASLAITPNGTAVVVWQENHSNGAAIVAATQSPSGARSAPVTLSDRGVAPAVVANGEGEAIATWQQEIVPETGGGIASAAWSSGRFGAVETVDAGQSYAPIMAAAGDGNVVLAYFQGAAGFGDWRARPPAGAFGPAQPLPGGPAFVVERTRNVMTLGVVEGAQGMRVRLYDAYM